MLVSNSIHDLRVLLEPYTLLYVEDNIGLNTKGTELFKKIFNNVYSASDGMEGLIQYKKYHPQIVITDIGMPKLDGFDMSDEILRIDPEVKIIVTTAYNDHLHLHRSIRIGVFDYLSKPVRLEDIIESLFRCAKALSNEFYRKIFITAHPIQNNLGLLMNGNDVMIVNQSCLDFFGVQNVEIFRNMFPIFGEVFQCAIQPLAV